MGWLDDICLNHPHKLREQTKGETPRVQVRAAIGHKQGDKIVVFLDRAGYFDAHDL